MTTLLVSAILPLLCGSTQANFEGNYSDIDRRVQRALIISDDNDDVSEKHSEGKDHFEPRAVKAKEGFCLAHQKGVVDGEVPCPAKAVDANQFVCQPTKVTVAEDCLESDELEAGMYKAKWFGGFNDLKAAQEFCRREMIELKDKVGVCNEVLFGPRSCFSQDEGRCCYELTEKKTKDECDKANGYYGWQRLCSSRVKCEFKKGFCVKAHCPLKKDTDIARVIGVQNASKCSKIKNAKWIEVDAAWKALRAYARSVDDDKICS